MRLTSCWKPDSSEKWSTRLVGKCSGGTQKEGKWRVCVDYTNLNNACPKDSFPLPRIDQIVDSTAGQGMLSFLDAFSGYHQIPMSPADEEKQPS
ncbi:Transposon Ty3-I Gag-Pol polyprotein [Vitis vinifera]|uniref:Transposon Ty3-I Gag-Pol polyprotein n=1 Tax=Vitis vinifera TaxID=29760 RepID=A0A438CXB3_VITVI|nr:Transposon Ty3-I Gag-Pol polyprotein [Vitis vinifera]